MLCLIVLWGFSLVTACSHIVSFATSMTGCLTVSVDSHTSYSGVKQAYFTITMCFMLPGLISVRCSAAWFPHSNSL